MPALPSVEPSVETNRWGRWWRVVADARASRSSTAVALAPASTPAGVSRGATTSTPPPDTSPPVPGTTRYTLRSRTGPPSARASSSCSCTRRCAPGIWDSCWRTHAAAARSGGEPGGRSGATPESWLASSRVPWPSIVDGSAGSGPGSGASRVSSATTRATPATSQQVR
ncbi:hypothetical protein [Miltoncostaea marina]|uniref:hypothetical protein n=1 Tax=Miltoncostaea marina TaxID=2843215 RepID=UPI001C3C5815|nr:hypothetical protein [Miltoncostaea marina]